MFSAIRWKKMFTGILHIRKSPVMCVQRKKINQTTVRHSTLTHVVDDEALALAEDEPGWI